MRRHSLICRFGATDRSRVQVLERESLVTEIPFVADDRFAYGLGTVLEEMAALGLRPSEASFDLALLSAAVFCADTRINRKLDSQEGWTREIDIYLPVHQPQVWSTQGPLLQRTLRFLTGDEWRFFFRRRPNGFDQVVAGQQGEFSRFDCVSLFSGGLDSYIGGIDLLAAGRRPLFVSHYLDGITSQHQRICSQHLEHAFPNEEFNSIRSYVCFGKDLIANNAGEPSQRSRSFLFFGLGVLVGSGFNGGTTLYAPENGFIALNVPLDSLRVGALSTRTTHPFYIARVNELVRELKIAVQIENPYRHSTKGEMCNDCKNRDLLRRTAKDTMSCASPTKGRWKKLPPGHCGYCVPCLIRRAALMHCFGADDTYYQIGDLTAASPLNANTAEGEHVRSFQMAAARLALRPNLAGLAIHTPGPLEDVESEWVPLTNVYANGLREVAALLRPVEVRGN